MYCLRSGTRMLQGRPNIRASTFTLYNTMLEEKAEISAYAAWLLRKAHNKNSFEALKKSKATRVFLNQLIDMGFIQEMDATSVERSTVFLGKKVSHHFPLTALNIELTNICNLRCEHCYGAFSDTIRPKFVPFEWIKNSIQDFNRLHVRKIALTGGEATIHPQFLEISKLLLKHGFDLCVFTNGYNYKIIEELLAISEGYHLTIKVSLDGMGEIHNQIRGNHNAYSNALKTIEAISKYPNVTLYISTSVLRRNIDEILTLEQELASRFPNAIHTKDLAFPLGKADSCAFSMDELPDIYSKLPGLFIRHRSSEIKETEPTTTRLRCTGGVSQCTLMPDGKLKICNAACNEQFYFKYNAYSKGLRYAWINCGKAVGKFRHEKQRETDECKKCNYQQSCQGSNCRVLAWVYTGDANKSNPLTCFSTHKMAQE